MLIILSQSINCNGEAPPDDRKRRTSSSLNSSYMDDHLGQLNKITYAEFHHVLPFSIFGYVLFFV